SKGIKALACAADAADPASLGAAIAKARKDLGPVCVVHWNAFGGEARDLLAADRDALRRVFDIAVAGLLAVIQDTRADLRSTRGAILVTNGAFGDDSPTMDRFAVAMKTMGIALANAAKRKLVGLLAEALREDGIYVGEVTVAGAVTGTPFAAGGDGIDPAAIAARFWELYSLRSEIRARID
ncbi:MAG: hypothetical protein JOZ55_04200, partial [Alphaproteobacteria bacterium]|nr:hypothetical protein [Alphaproteobacteria bacterium]